MVSLRHSLSWTLLVIALTAGAFVVTSTLDLPEASAQRRVKKAKKKRKKRKKRRSKKISSKQSVLGVRGGLIASGSGSVERKVSGGNTSTTDFTEESGYAANGYVLFPIAPKIRAGGSLWYFPTYKANLDGSRTDGDETTALHLNAMGEYAIALKGSPLDGFVYAEAGLSMIFPAEGDKDGQTSSGYNVAIGGGATYYVSRALGLRADLRFEPFYSTTATLSNGSGDTTVTTSGQRIMLNAGLIFGL